MILNEEYAKNSGESLFTVKFQKYGIYICEVKMITLTTNDGREMLGLHFIDKADENNQHVEPIYDGQHLINGTKFEKMTYADLSKLLKMYDDEVNKRDRKVKYEDALVNFKTKLKLTNDPKGDDILRFIRDKYNVSQFMSTLLVLMDVKIPALKSQKETETFLKKVDFKKAVKLKAIAVKKNTGEFEIKVNLRSGSMKAETDSLNFTTQELQNNMLFDANNAISSPQAQETLVNNNTKEIDQLFGLSEDEEPTKVEVPKEEPKKAEDEGFSIFD